LVTLLGLLWDLPLEKELEFVHLVGAYPRCKCTSNRTEGEIFERRVQHGLTR